MLICALKVRLLKFLSLSQREWKMRSECLESACPVCAGGHAGECSSLSVRLWVRGWKILSKQSSWKINKLWTTLRWQFEKSHVLIPPSAQRHSSGERLSSLSSSVIPSVNSSGGISLLSDARWHYLLRGRWLERATGLNSPRQGWYGELDDILFLWRICECISERERSSTTVHAATGKPVHILEVYAAVIITVYFTIRNHHEDSSLKDFHCWEEWNSW